MSPTTGLALAAAIVILGAGVLLALAVWLRARAHLMTLLNSKSDMPTKSSMTQVLPARAAQLLARVKASDWGRQIDWKRVEAAYRSRKTRARRPAGPSS